MRETGITLSEWYEDIRQQPFLDARCVVAWIGRTKLGMNFETIATVCGWGSHSTARDAVKIVSSDPSMLDRSERLYEKYKGAA